MVKYVVNSKIMTMSVARLGNLISYRTLFLDSGLIKGTRNFYEILFYFLSLVSNSITLRDLLGLKSQRRGKYKKETRKLNRPNRVLSYSWQE